jgi:hypothetical protein
MSRSLAWVTILMVVVSLRSNVALAVPAAPMQAAASTDTPVTIVIPKQRWIKIFNFTGALAMADPVEIQCLVAGYAGEEVVVVLEWSTTEQAAKPEVRRFRQPMEPIKVQRPTMTAYGSFVMEAALEGRGRIDVYLTDKKEHIISNRVSIPAAAGPAAEKALEAELGPATKREPE